MEKEGARRRGAVIVAAYNDARVSLSPRPFSLPLPSPSFPATHLPSGSLLGDAVLRYLLIGDIMILKDGIPWVLPEEPCGGERTLSPRRVPLLGAKFKIWFCPTLSYISFPSFPSSDLCLFGFISVCSPLTPSYFPDLRISEK